MSTSEQPRATQPFDGVLGAGRGGGAKAADPDADRLHPTALVRFSVHPSNGLHIYEDQDSSTLVKALTEHADRCAREAELVARCAEHGWKVRAVKSAGNSWVQVTKLVATIDEAVAELRSFGADDTYLDCFPSGSPQDRTDHHSAWVTQAAS